ncbi:hypothetical protein KPH14_001341 [Odynerus spinipes]|uniref:Autophagy-related protein 101 n=1 Tax=Odynerus spinipes TaxID=1348599 RepID=A0AAD9RE92_9HYME|nr:hypothetical protein KPH14_001341 [Odynerus spinipes]
MACATSTAVVYPQSSNGLQSLIMNARTQLFELSMEGRQVDEAVASIFHSVLFHRSLGKFKYKQEGSYSVGTVGYQDVDCDFIDFTYVCCSSVHLDQTLKREISGFSEALRSTDSPGSGQISLEFFQKKKNRWPFQPECIPWEVWTVRLELIKLATEHERQICREKVGDLLTDKILYITEVMNRHDYLPKMPNQAELDFIFDTSYPDIQPYLFKLSFTTSSPSSTTMGIIYKNRVRYKYIREIGLPEYLSRAGTRDSQMLIAQARCGNIEPWNRYWEKDEGKKCDLCGDSIGSLEHLTRDCRETERGISIEEVVGGRVSERVIKWLRKLKKKREKMCNN